MWLWFPLLMPNIPPVPPHSLTSQNCPISPVFLLLFSSSPTLSLAWEDRSMVHYWLLLIGSLNSPPPLSLYLNTLLKQEVEFLSCARCCLVFSRALCSFIQTLVRWFWPLGGSVSGVLPNPLCSRSKLLPPLQLSLPVPPVLHCPLWVYCLHLIYLNPAVFSQETVQHRAVCLCRPTLLVCPGLISCSLVTLMVLYYGTENHHWFELIIMTEDAFNVPWKKSPSCSLQLVAALY